MVVVDINHALIDDCKNFDLSCLQVYELAVVTAVECSRCVVKVDVLWDRCGKEQALGL